MENSEKLELLTDTVFDILAAEVHKKNPFAFMYVKNSIADSLYKQAPHYISGKISKRAREKLEERKITRKKLCREHPTSRVKTALDIISDFDYKYSNNKITNTEIKTSISSFIEQGSKCHFVLSTENYMLKPFQQNYSLSEDEIYSLANVELVEDTYVFTLPDKYEYEGTRYKSQPEIASALNISKYAVKKMIDSGEIESIEFETI